MRKHRLSFFLLLFFLQIFSLYSDPFSLSPLEETHNLLQDLEIVEYWEKRGKESPPLFYNHLLQSGYFNMPSARMGEEGTLGFGFSWVPPYRNYNLHFQLFDRLEISGNYRIFSGISDPNLSQFGFGDYSDKGANIKLSIFQPRDSDYLLPGIAVGLEDFLGSKLFYSKYIIFTQLWPEHNLEASFGIGGERIQGVFGGIAWAPWHGNKSTFLEPLTFVAEYDATDYETPSKEPHPEARYKKSPINYGMKYRVADYWDASISHVRGDVVAGSLNLHYNLGKTEGFLPKTDEPHSYAAPVNVQKLGALRSKQSLAQEFVFAFEKQGFKILDLLLYPEKDHKTSLWIKIQNTKYNDKDEVHKRLCHLLKSLSPNNLSNISVTLEAGSIPCHTYVFRKIDLERMRERKSTYYELEVLTPLKEAWRPHKTLSEPIYHANKSPGSFFIKPRMRSFFGSAKGKFKYELGVASGIEGFLLDSLFYRCEASYTLNSTMEDLGSTDRLNPSQIINVQTDYILYRQDGNFSLDEAYIQKSWNMGKGFYSRVSCGHFQTLFGGAASEILYFPVNSPWAVGLEGAVINKRKYHGLKFAKQVRKLSGFHPSYEDYSGRQYFLDLYYDFSSANVDLKVSAGQFLAFDKGVRTEVSRYFENGLRISLWYTVTDGKDKINGETYFDKGVAFTMPLDIFYSHRSREKWGYSMSAWLRDVGVRSNTGRSLYSIIKEERR